jgi:hypothetical protein
MVSRINERVVRMVLRVSRVSAALIAWVPPSSAVRVVALLSA